MCVCVRILVIFGVISSRSFIFKRVNCMVGSGRVSEYDGGSG